MILFNLFKVQGSRFKFRVQGLKPNNEQGQPNWISFHGANLVFFSYLEKLFQKEILL